MKIGYDAKRYYHNNTGLGNYSRTLINAIHTHYPKIDTKLYDEKALIRTFWMGHKAKEDGCVLFHGLSNELPRDINKVGIKSIVTMHDVAWRTFPRMYKPIDIFLYEQKYGWSAKHATHVICISESTKKDVMRFYGVPEERISVIYQPVQQLFYTQMEKQKAADIVKEYVDDDFILTVGSINARKNLLGMLKAYARLEKRPKFVVIGNGHEYRKLCEKFIAEKGLSNDVIIIDNIHEGYILQAFYTCAKVLMYPSYYEGFGLPVVEAALQHCPIITSNVSSLPEAAGAGAIQVAPNDIKTMASSLNRLLTDPQECTYLGQKAYEHATTHFNPEELTNDIYKLYNSIL
jgi:glycosyltransferase involved in cell wall biosynthesis